MRGKKTRRFPVLGSSIEFYPMNFLGQCDAGIVPIIYNNNNNNTSSSNNINNNNINNINNSIKSINTSKLLSISLPPPSSSPPRYMSRTTDIPVIGHGMETSMIFAKDLYISDINVRGHRSRSHPSTHLLTPYRKRGVHPCHRMQDDPGEIPIYDIVCISSDLSCGT